MKEYNVFSRFGRGHNILVGSISGSNTKHAFKRAVIRHFKPNRFDAYFSFFVEVNHTDIDKNDFISYGYDCDGQRSSFGGFRTSLKGIIETILLDESLKKSIEGFDLN